MDKAVLQDLYEQWYDCIYCSAMNEVDKQDGSTRLGIYCECRDCGKRNYIDDSKTEFSL